MSKIVKIRLVEKKGSSTFNGFVRYRNTKDYITPYYDSRGSMYTGLTLEDEKYFGEKLKQDLSSLSPYWHDFKIVMTDKEMELDLDNVMHQLQFKFLENHFRVAKSLTDSDIGIKDYYIVDESKEAEVANNRASIKIKANKLFSSLSDENKKDILKLYPGFTSMSTVSSDIIDAKLYEQLELNPSKFVEHVEDKKRDSKVLIKDLISVGILRKNKSSFYYGEDFLGHDEESTIQYINDPDRQGLKIDLIKQLEAKSKK